MMEALASSNIHSRIAGVLLLGALLLLPAAFAPPPAAAACGTNWTSRQEPPQTIRVLRTGTGAVDKVNFKRYVGVVMASGEWPETMPQALLEAGALATKQYGWYYALKGNHRSGYQTSSGACYDVRDDARDQVYRPESAEPTEKQLQARDALWGLSLRKRDEFFLTGYRRGSATKCAADADSWHLYTKSAKDCVKRLDYDSERILRAYYRPGLVFVWAPGTEPEPQESDADAIEPEEGSAATGDEMTTDEASGLLDAVSGWFARLFTRSE